MRLSFGLHESKNLYIPQRNILLVTLRNVVKSA